MSPVRRAKHETPAYVVDAGGDPVEVGGQCGLFIDLQPEDQAPMPGDWVATAAGSRYFVDAVHVVRRAKHQQSKRYQMRTLRLPKHTNPPEDVRVIWLSWYPRGARR
jgi:hypothetical protein